MHKYPYLEQVCREHGYVVTCDQIVEFLTRSDDPSRMPDRERLTKLLKKGLISHEEAVRGMYWALFVWLGPKFNIGGDYYDHDGVTIVEKGLSEEMQQSIAGDLERLLFDESLPGNS